MSSTRRAKVALRVLHIAGNALEVSRQRCIETYSLNSLSRNSRVCPTDSLQRTPPGFQNPEASLGFQASFKILHNSKLQPKELPSLPSGLRDLDVSRNLLMKVSQRSSVCRPQLVRSMMVQIRWQSFLRRISYLGSQLMNLLNVCYSSGISMISC